MRKVNTIDELIAEKARLTSKKINLENDIQNNVTEIKDSLKPLSILTKGVKGIAHTKDSSDFISNSAGTLVEMLVRNIVFRNSGLLAKWLLPKLVKNATSNAVHNNRSFLFEKLADLIGSFRSKKSGKHFDESTIYAES